MLSARKRCMLQFRFAVNTYSAKNVYQNGHIFNSSFSIQIRNIVFLIHTSYHIAVLCVFFFFGETCSMRLDVNLIIYPLIECSILATALVMNIYRIKAQSYNVNVIVY